MMWVFLFNNMDKIEIIEALEDTFGTSEPKDVNESDRWILYSNLKSNIKATSSPDDYTRQIILICETLEL